MPVEIDIEELSAILRKAAVAEVLPRFRRLGREHVREKSEAIDLVTEADEAAERLITAELNRRWPEARVIGEEAASADPAILDGLAEMELAIIVDPIDGTANYAAGIPMFGVMASIVRRGEIVGGIIYDPMGDDWVVAEKGAGAWLVRPDGSRERQSAAPAVPMSQMVGLASAFYLPQQHRAHVLKNLAQVRMSTVLRNAAHSYRTFAAGHFHYLMFYSLMPWDHAVGALISTEAGGYVARLDGDEYSVARRDGGILVASDKESWSELREKIFNF